MQIRLATPKDKQAWDAYVNSRQDAAPYCYFSWKEAVEQAYGFQPCYLLAEEAGIIKGILPLFIFRVPLFGCSLISLPYCDVGDILASDNEITKALSVEAVNIARREKAKSLVIRSSQKDLFSDTFLDWHVSVETSKVRMLLPLPDSSEELWKSFKSKLRSQIRKAEKNGLSFRWGTPHDIDTFYRVFSRNMHALGSPVHSRKWIEKILVNYGENVRMGLVFKDDNPIGCGIIIFNENTVSIPWASTLREYNRLSPNMMLYWNFLKHAADSKAKVFDFGRSTLNEGTYKFKKQWGAKPKTLFWYEVNLSSGDRQFVVKTTGSGNRETLANIWSKMPSFVVSFLGPKIRKYISL